MKPETKVFNPLLPQQSRIELQLRSDSRQAGQSRLAHKLAEFLAREGYSNVYLTSAIAPAGHETAHPFADLTPQAQQVQIEVLDLPPSSRVPVRRYAVPLR